MVVCLYIFSAALCLSLVVISPVFYLLSWYYFLILFRFLRGTDLLSALSEWTCLLAPWHSAQLMVLTPPPTTHTTSTLLPTTASICVWDEYRRYADLRLLHILKDNFAWTNKVLFIGYLNGENIPVHVNIQSTPLNIHINSFFGIDAHCGHGNQPTETLI